MVGCGIGLGWLERRVVGMVGRFVLGVVGLLL